MLDTIEVKFGWEDVQSIADTHEQVNDGPEITEDEARAWLAENGKYIRDRLIELGNAAIEDMLAMYPIRTHAS